MCARRGWTTSLWQTSKLCKKHLKGFAMWRVHLPDHLTSPPKGRYRSGGDTMVMSYSIIFIPKAEAQWKSMDALNWNCSALFIKRKSNFRGMWEASAMVWLCFLLWYTGSCIERGQGLAYCGCLLNIINFWQLVSLPSPGWLILRHRCGTFAIPKRASPCTLHLQLQDVARGKPVGIQMDVHV